MAMTADTAISKYIELRTRRAELKSEFEKADGQLKELQGKLEKWILSSLEEQGGDSIGTPHGTAYKTYKEYVSIDNPEAFFSYVVENQDYGMFERRVSKTAVKEYMSPDANGEYTQPPPPGVRYVKEVAIGIRKK